MVIKSRFSAPIPQVSVPTYIFDSPTAPLPNQPAYISCDSPEKYQISLPEYRLYAQRFASGLLRMGLQPGERVLLFSGNTLFFPSVVMGIIMAEGIFTGANPSYVARELAYQLKDSGARYLLCAENSLDTGIAAAKEAGMAASQIFVFDDGIATFEGRKVECSTELGHIRHWTELLDSPERGAAYAWPELKTKDEVDRVIILNYSSGTTGVAKGVMITHRNHIANCVQTIHVNSKRENYEESQKRARQLCLLPMYHAYAQSVSVEFEQLWADRKVNLKQGWGMTEVTCAGTIWDPNRRSTNASVGEILPNCEMKIVVDDAGLAEAPQGERGEVWIRGPNVMKGYWNKPDATKETLTEDGWLKTGDVAYVDADNYLFIVDRKKELIKVKGMQVAPAELEALLLDHPDVQDVAVIGVHANDTELPRAYIVLRTADKKTPATAETIKSWLAERVSRFKRLEGGVHFVDAIPKNPTGKILRRELREMAAGEDTKAKL
ncbi:hypothetical protein CFE70_004857 [Pyrenophora teres f. teres 0-1]